MVRPVRYHARFVCDIPVDIHSPALRSRKPLGQGHIVNISMGGVGVMTTLKIERSVPYEFRFEYADQKLRLTGRLAWEKPQNPKTPEVRGYGISCTLSVRQEQAMKIVVDRLRTEQWPTADDRMRNYWSI
ncbi:MAG: PilZ domain-containing protein [Elusimicrobia bacterium]|nr:PilZ domain-containing protein [Elusimicrobiota bacterium]